MKKTGVVFLLLFFTLTGYSQSVKEFLKKGEQQYAAKEFENALKTYKQGLALHPNSAQLNFQTGLTYLSLPNKKESLRYLQTAFTINPSVDDNIYYYLGMSYQNNRQYEKAQEFFAEFKRRNKQLGPEVDKKIRQSQFADSLTKTPANVIVENVGKVINSSFHEYSPLVSMDGNTMIFTSNRPDKAEPANAFSRFEDIYISRKVNGQWSEPTKISPNINIRFNDAAASLSGDGKTLMLYYEYGGGDIYTSTLKDDEWTKPVPLNENINTPLFWETSGFLTADGQKLYFTSNRPGGIGNLDIYASEMEKTGDWGKATNLGPVINTIGREDAPVVSPDGQTMYFSSDGHPSMGGTDIFKSELKDGKWQKPVNMGYPVNSVEDDSFFAIAEDRKRAYFSTLREEGNAEIYTLTFIEPDQKIAATTEDIAIKNIDTTTVKTEEPVIVAKEPIKPTRDVATTKKSPAPNVLPKREKRPEPIAEVNTGVRKFLFFGINKDALTSESVAKLESVHVQLNEDMQMTMLIEGHTDNTGNELLNKALSVKRANAVAKYLTTHGINPGRLSVKAYGSKKPLVSNDDEEDGREINRRIEMRFTRQLLSRN